MHIYLCVYIYIYTHTYRDRESERYIYTYIYIYIYVYIYIHVEREREMITHLAAWVRGTCGCPQTASKSMSSEGVAHATPHDGKKNTR